MPAAHSEPALAAPNDESLTTWVVGAVLTLFLGALTFLANTVFSGITRDIKALGEKQDAANEKVVSEVRAVAALVQQHSTQLALTHQDIGQIKEELRRLERENELASKRHHALVNALGPEWAKKMHDAGASD